MTDADHPVVLALNEQFVELLAPLDAERLRWLVSLADRADILEVDGEVGGFVVTFRPGSAYDSDNYRWFAQRYGDDVYYLDRVVVAGHLRRRGLAGLIYDELEAVAQPFGRMGLEVNADPPNEPSLVFHTGRSYAEVGRLGEPGHVVALMVKELGR